MKISKPLRKLERIKTLFYKQNGRCSLCGQPMHNEMIEYEEWIMSHLKQVSPQKRRGQINLNIDHIVPVSKGGKDKKRNKQLVHSLCNSIKGNLEPEQLEIIGERLFRKTFNSELFNDSA